MILSAVKVHSERRGIDICPTHCEIRLRHAWHGRRAPKRVLIEHQRSRVACVLQESSNSPCRARLPALDVIDEGDLLVVAFDSAIVSPKCEPEHERDKDGSYLPSDSDHVCYRQLLLMPQEHVRWCVKHAAPSGPDHLAVILTREHPSDRLISVCVVTAGPSAVLRNHNWHALCRERCWSVGVRHAVIDVGQSQAGR